MATPNQPGTGRGARGQFFPDAQGNYHTGNSYFDQRYKIDDQLQAKALANPDVAKLVAAGGTGTINKISGDTDVRVVNGKITQYSTGGVWKPLIMAGIVAGTGGIAGAYAASTAATGAATTGAATAATTAATVAPSTASAASGLVGPALRYGLPMAGNLVNGIIQNRANSQAASAEQRYLEDALDYAKEQDTYNRGLDSEALKYQRESDVYNRGLAATALAKEESRYAGYQDRIGGFIANGQTSNDRMSALLGLPARPAGSGGGGGGYQRQAVAPVATEASNAAWSAFDQLFPGETLTPQMLSQNEAKLKALGFSLRPNAAGVVGKIQYGNDPIADVIQGAGSGLNRKQRLYG